MTDVSATPTTVYPVLIALSEGALMELDRLAARKWAAMDEVAQMAMTNMLAQQDWKFSMIVGGSLMTQILAMAQMGADQEDAANPPKPKPPKDEPPKPTLYVPG